MESLPFWHGLKKFGEQSSAMDMLNLLHYRLPRLTATEATERPSERLL